MAEPHQRPAPHAQPSLRTQSFAPSQPLEPPPQQDDEWAQFPIVQGVSVSGDGDPWARFPIVQPAEPHAQPKGPQTSTAAALAEGIGQGVTIGFGDEIEGAVRGGIDALTSDKSFSEAYGERRDAARARQRQARETNPAAFYTGEIGSALATPFTIGPKIAAGAAYVLPNALMSAGRAAGFGATKAAAGAGLGARTVAGAREGAAYGALGGVGHAEGGAQEHATNALIGAGAGGLLGAALPGTIDLGSAVIRRTITNPYRAHFNPEEHGRAKYAEATVRDLTPNGFDADAARTALARQENRLTHAQAQKPGIVAMDMGGENTRNLVRAAYNQQSPAAQSTFTKLNRRQNHQWSRLERDLDETLGTEPGKDFHYAVVALTRNRQRHAEPAFQRAYNAPWNVKPDDDLARFFQERGYVRRLIEKADESIRGMTGEDLAQTGPWEFIHRGIFGELNREIGRLKRGQPDAKANWTARDLVEIKNELKGLIEKHNPHFGRALKQYSDASSLIRAAEDGFEEGMKTPPEILKRNMYNMEPQEAQMYRLGVARSIIDDIRKGNVNNDRTKSVFSSPDTLMRLRAVFPDQKSLNEFRKRVHLEIRMARSRAAVQGGSPTAKQLVQGDEAGSEIKAIEGVGALAGAAMGGTKSLFQTLGQHISRFTNLTPEASDAILRAAMSKNLFKDRAMWERAIERAEKQPEARAALVRRILAATGTPIGELQRGPTPVTIGRPEHWDQNPNRNSK